MSLRRLFFRILIDFTQKCGQPTRKKRMAYAPIHTKENLVSPVKLNIRTFFKIVNRQAFTLHMSIAALDRTNGQVDLGHTCMYRLQLDFVWKVS